MGRKAKEAAQIKIGEWTGARPKTSTTLTTTTKTDNASTENRAPLQTQSQSDINAMKNCSVRLENIKITTKKVEQVNKIRAGKKVPATDVNDKQNDAKNVYDYTFDAEDDLGPMNTTESEMKDLFEKLAKDNIIEMKKHRPKIVKKKKTEEKTADKKTVTQKRRREKQPVEIEPLQKKSNLKVKFANVPKPGTSSANTVAVPSKRNIETENLANGNVPVNSSKQPVNTVTRSSANKQANIENVNANSRLRNRVLQNFQSTPKSSTPLGLTANAKSREKDRSLNSLFFDNASPLVDSNRSNRAKNGLKQRLHLSAINDIQENSPNVSLVQNKENENVPQVDYDDGDNFDFGTNMANEPEPEPNVDKENELNRPSTSAAALKTRNETEKSEAVSNAQNKASTSSSVSNLWDQPSTSAAALRSLERPGTNASTSNAINQPSTSSRSWDQPSTSAAAKTSIRSISDRSVFDIPNTSDYNVFSPTKRVYGRSPLKNITSEVNNTNSPSFESVKSSSSALRSFGVLPNSTKDTIRTTKDIEFTLPEASYFSSRRDARDFDRAGENQNFADDCFGFYDSDDEVEITNNNNDIAETTKTDDIKIPLMECLAKFKRFRQNPEAQPILGIKKSKNTKAAVDKNKGKKVKSPVKISANATNKSPAKQKRNVIFGDTGAKQKDIRSAFTSSDKQKQDKSTDDPAVALFGENDTVQDRRKSYSRPQRQRKRRISNDSDESEDEQQNDDDEDFDENGKQTKRAKRRKKTTQTNPKEIEEMEEFARKTNQHFDEIDSFDMVIE